MYIAKRKLREENIALKAEIKLLREAAKPKARVVQGRVLTVNNVKRYHIVDYSRVNHGFMVSFELNDGTKANVSGMDSYKSANDYALQVYKDLGL